MVKTMAVNGYCGRRRVRLTRQLGQSLVLSRIGDSGDADAADEIEVRVTRVCPEGAAVLEVLLPEDVFVECKETLDGVRALFTPAPA